MRAALLVPLLADLLPRSGTVGCTDPDVGAAVAEAGHDHEVLTDLAAAEEHGWSAALLLSGEVAAAGVRGPTLVAAAIRAVRPGGLVAVAAPSAVHGVLVDRSQDGSASDGPALTAEDAEHLLAERGVDVCLLAGVGAAAHVGGRPWAGVADLPHDRLPGLRDAGPVVLAAGTTPRTAAERSRTFFASITRKIVAASVVCTDEAGRVLLVDDLFKGEWTLPGGLVDAHEAPDAAAVREAYEEGGVEVVLGDLLGVFAHDHPDRIHLVYAASPQQPTPDPVPVHLHEVGASRWVSRARAEEMLPPSMRHKLAVCLDQPGRTWDW